MQPNTKQQFIDYLNDFYYNSNISDKNGFNDSGNYYTIIFDDTNDEEGFVINIFEDEEQNDQLDGGGKVSLIDSNDLTIESIDKQAEFMMDLCQFIS